ncbi:WD40 repeat-like protein [Trametes sanguinea]|nr:WD40 repeat-like protein [Trametes sanguinea]
MIQTGLIPNAHNDLVTDASYDFYGHRLATCSLDQRVKVWQLDETNGSWACEHEWKAHDAAISKISWAHPEFGTILATASFDRTVKIWEQVPALDGDGGGGGGVQLNGASGQQAAQSQLPGRPGLGTREIIQIPPSRRPSTLLSLNPAPSSDPSRSIASSASGPSTSTSTSAPTPGSTGDGADGAKTYAVTSVAWAPSCGRSYHLVATGGRDGHVRIWRVKPPAPSSEEADGYGEDGPGAQEGGAGRWSASVVGDFDDHKSAVGRVEWNITGTILSSAGNDGRVRLWKMTAGNVWRPAGHISVEQAEEQQADVDMGEMAVED